jgi:signal transduction histidine kinase/ActR/RegA family two-component response regulator
MRDYTPAARAYWFAVVIIGFGLTAFALVQLASRPPEVLGRIVIAAAVAAAAGVFPVRIPGSTRAIVGGDIFVFLAFMLYGASAAIVVAVAQAAVGVVRFSRRWTSWLISPAANAIALTLAGAAVGLTPRHMPDAGAGPISLAHLLGLSLCFGWASLMLLHTLAALKTRSPVALLLWTRQHGWLLVLQLAWGAIAALLYMSEQRFGLEAILVATPLVAACMGGLHFYFEKRNADARHMVELMESRRRLQEALATAERASRAKTRFLAAASHDLRQPLHALTFLTAALDMRPLDAPAREIVRKMTGALEDLSGEFDALLDISKLDAGLVTISASSFEAEPFLGRVAEAFVPVARARGLLFEVSGDSGVYVRTDRPLFERVVRNLLDNAFKYTEKGTVRLACTAAGARCRIVVADSGIGIPESEHEHVFEEFYQVGNPERDRRKGMGLGLSIVRRLTELLGVKLSMDSHVGRGTTFALELETVAAPHRVDEPAQAPSSGLADRQVLLVDDEVAPRDALRAYLEGLGCHVSVAGTLREAATAAMLDEPDIVLADFRLRQGETGLEAIQRLRESRPRLPAIIVTGDTAPERLAELDGTGIEVLHKPVPPARLVARMTALVASQDTAATAAVETTPGG